MVFPENDYDTSGSFTYSDDQYEFKHKAYGAEMFRYSWNFGKNWTDWKAWEDSTAIDPVVFTDVENWWKGDHIMVQCKLLFITRHLYFFE